MSGPGYSYRDHNRGKLGLKELASGSTHAPGNSPGRGPWLKHFQANCINLIQMCPHLSLLYPFNAVHLVV